LHRQVVKVQQILHSEPSLDALSLRPNVTCSIKIIFRGRAGAYTHRPAGIEESRGCLGRSLEEDEVQLPPAHQKAQGPRLGFAAQGRVRAPGFSARSAGLGVVCVCMCVRVWVAWRWTAPSHSSVGHASAFRNKRWHEDGLRGTHRRILDHFFWVETHRHLHVKKRKVRQRREKKWSGFGWRVIFGGGGWGRTLPMKVLFSPSPISVCWPPGTGVSRVGGIAASG